MMKFIALGIALLAYAIIGDNVALSPDLVRLACEAGMATAILARCATLKPS